MGIARYLTRAWSVKNDVPRPSPEVIAVITYGMTAAGLSESGKEGMKEAIRLAKMFPNAFVAIGAFASAAVGTSEKEKELKIKMLLDASIDPEKILYAGPMTTTIDEAEAHQALFEDKGFSPRSIVVVAGMAHSRTARYVWRKLNPGVRISMAVFDASRETQPDQPMIFARKLSMWLGVNILRHVFLRLFGFKIMRCFRQPTADRRFSIFHSGSGH